MEIAIRNGNNQSTQKSIIKKKVVVKIQIKLKMQN